MCVCGCELYYDLVLLCGCMSCFLVDFCISVEQGFCLIQVNSFRRVFYWVSILMSSTC